jgi:hypothetical protein
MPQLKEKDLELIGTNRNLYFVNPKNAYLGGVFGSKPEDYVEVLIYDMNENLLESSIVDKDDYEITADQGDGGVNLKTGTILRRLGYDRGKFTVKYNFLRLVAGSYENILVDRSDNRYYGEFDSNSDADRARIGNDLFIKEYKYYIHETSPTKKEVRLAPQNIGYDSKYKKDFFNLQRNEKLDSTWINDMGSLEFVGEPQSKGDSLEIQVPTPDDTGEVRTGGLTLDFQMIGGTITLDDAFYMELPLFITPEQMQETLESEYEELLDEQANWDYGGS